MKNVIAQIVEQRKKDIATRGYNFGFEIPKKRIRPVNPFMAERGVILEVKRASPSKGDIAPDLNPAETAKKYRRQIKTAGAIVQKQNGKYLFCCFFYNFNFGRNTKKRGRKR